MKRQVLGRFEPGIWVITVVGLLNAAGFSISVPFLALYLYQDRSVSMTMVGAIILSSGLFSALAQMYSGVLTDRFGRRPMLLGTVLAGVFLQLAMAGLVAVSAPVVYIALAFTCVRAALMMGRPAFSAIVADTAPKHRLTESYGLLRVGQNVGWAMGPAAGGYLAASLSYSWLFVFAGLMGAVTLVVVLFSVRESATSFSGSAGGVRSLLSGGLGRSFIEFIALGMLIFLVMGQMISTLSVYTVDHAGFSTAQYGLLLTLNGVLVVLLQYPVTRAMGRTTIAAALVTGCVLYGVGYLTFSWVGGMPLAMVGMAVVTLGEVVLAPTTLAVVAELSPSNWRGRYMGLYGLGETVGHALGPMVGGVLLDAFPSQPLFIWGTIFLLALAAAVGFYLWNSRRRGRTGGVSAA